MCMLLETCMHVAGICMCVLEQYNGLKCATLRIIFSCMHGYLVELATL